MYYSSVEVVFQEVPGEISICFTITGCELFCKGCHSPNLWKKGSGQKLTDELYVKILEKYKEFATCVLFMGGEWYEEELCKKLKTAKEKGYKTCLYTGLTNISSSKIKNLLTWLKTGAWVQKLGGLESKTTNQQFIEVNTNNILNHLFQKL